LFLSYGTRSKCCYAPIRMGTRKIKNSSREVKIWICCNCKKKDVDIIEYRKDGDYKPAFAPVDTEDEDVLE